MTYNKYKCLDCGKTAIYNQKEPAPRCATCRYDRKRKQTLDGYYRRKGDKMKEGTLL